MAAQAKTFSYAVSLDRDWAGTSTAGGSPLPDEGGWSPEHLLLAGLARCTLTSLDYHARRVGVGAAERRSAGRGPQRTRDGRYAFVQVDVELDVSSTRPRRMSASCSRRPNATASSAPR